MHSFVKFIVISAAVGMAAAPDSTSAQLIAGLKVRRSVWDKSAVEKPAAITITWPGEGKTSFALDVGTTVLLQSFLIGNSQWDPAVAAEYHRHTATDAEQNSFVGTVTLYGVVGDVTTSGWSVLPQLSAKYKSDEVRDARSALGIADFDVVVPSAAIGQIHNVAGVGLVWQPRLGMEYENTLRAPDAAAKGHVARGLGVLEVAVYPLGSDRRLELTASGYLWQDLSRTGAFETGRRNHRLLLAGARYYLTPQQNFAIGLEHFNGENPREGIAQQRYLELTLQFKL